MGFQQLLLKLPTDYTDEQLRESIRTELKLSHFTYTIDTKSLDARNKRKIHWQIRVGVSSDEIDGEEQPSPPELHIPRVSNSPRAVIVGSGPAGLFAALVLQRAGCHTIIIERGSKVDQRAAAIHRFEHGGEFNPQANYAFGEGGAGTFSDGKLTARTKNIHAEKRFILDHYISAGGPEEIGYLAHPHLGTDKLRHIVANLRRHFTSRGGSILFNTEVTGLLGTPGLVEGVTTTAGDQEADFLILAPGHSAYETYRMLISQGVLFRTKNFAIGSRVEHPQELINMAQWGCRQLRGVKAAEYRLASKSSTLPVFTFCMCPGGVVVPATAYPETNIVNGMSRYKRNGAFANAACVAGINLEQLLGRPVDSLEALDWLESLERSFFDQVNDYQAPYTTIQGFIRQRLSETAAPSSYPLGLQESPLWDMLPPPVSSAITDGLKEFCRKIKGFEDGIILGLESKTSAPLQVLRDESRRCSGWNNLYMAGEGSGWSGGIISSGVDGIRTALAAIRNNGQLK